MLRWIAKPTSNPSQTISCKKFSFEFLLVNERDTADGIRTSAPVIEPPCNDPPCLAPPQSLFPHPCQSGLASQSRPANCSLRFIPLRNTRAPKLHKVRTHTWAGCLSMRLYFSSSFIWTAFFVWFFGTLQVNGRCDSHQIRASKVF